MAEDLNHPVPLRGGKPATGPQEKGAAVFRGGSVVIYGIFSVANGELFQPEDYGIVWGNLFVRKQAGRYRQKKASRRENIQR